MLRVLGIVPSAAKSAAEIAKIIMSYRDQSRLLPLTGAACSHLKSIIRNNSLSATVSGGTFCCFCASVSHLRQLRSTLVDERSRSISFVAVIFCPAGWRGTVISYICVVRIRFKCVILSFFRSIVRLMSCPLFSPFCQAPTSLLSLLPMRWQSLQETRGGLE